MRNADVVQFLNRIDAMKGDGQDARVDLRVGRVLRRLKRLGLIRRVILGDGIGFELATGDGQNDDVEAECVMSLGLEMAPIDSAVVTLGDVASERTDPSP